MVTRKSKPANKKRKRSRGFSAFGCTFTHLPGFFCEQLWSLEREGAIYDDHWIDELDDARHVQIVLSEDEAKDYARRLWSYELYLRAGQPKWARNVRGIDADVAHDADIYSYVLRDGTKVGPPNHCPAAFMGYLERIVSGDERRVVIELQGKESALFTLARSVRALTATIRAFNTREKGLQAWSVTCEDDVRDLLYVMLRPVLFDLVKEERHPR